MKKSKAFEEYVAQRCEEILEHDEEYKKLSCKLTEKLKELKSTLSDKQIKTFLEYEILDSELNEYVKSVLYKVLNL